ncbi:unnamed protein product, partial [Musa acuminata var. zebrina]
MIRTRDGLKICILCVKHASAKERKKIIKGIKGHVRKLSLDQLGSLGLFETCTDNVGELFRSNFGKEVVYELVVGGSDSILQSFADK